MAGNHEQWSDSSPHGPSSFYKRKRRHYLWPVFWWLVILACVLGAMWYGLEYVRGLFHALAQRGG